MISDLLNRRFVLDQLEVMRNQLTLDSKSREGGGPGAETVTLNDYQVALDIITATQGQENISSSGQKNFDALVTRRRGPKPPALDDNAFFSSNPIVSIVQSALEYYIDHPHSKDSATG